LAERIALRPGLQAEVAAIESAQARLRSLTVAESRAAAAVSALEASAAERAPAWARANGQDPPSLANGADLIEAREILQKAQAQAAAARAVEPALHRELESALARRARLEATIKELVRDVLMDEASAIAAMMAELERQAEAECAKLAALRRPLLRLMGNDAMTGRKTVSAVDGMIGERRYIESEARGLEPMFQKLADDLIGDASAALGAEGSKIAPDPRAI
jgi:hypothetical protein